MFRIEEGPHEAALDGHRTYVVDHERDVWLQRVSGLGFREEDPSGDCFKLVWEDRVIPFDAIAQDQLDERTNAKLCLVEFETFGASVIAKMRAGITTFAFASEGERRAARLLAAEALLIFGFIYDGDKYPDGYYRVRITDGGTSTDYSLSSFG